MTEPKHLSRQTRPLGRLAPLMLVALQAAALAATPASAAVLKVDDDGAQCPTATYATIQAAVAAASPGDTIKVCPGNYGGQVIVDKSLKIKGSAPKVSGCNLLSAPAATQYAIFHAPTATGVPGIGFDVQADKVSILSLVLADAGEAAIRTDPTHNGFTLKNSVFLGNANGVYLHSSGKPTTVVKANCFRQSGLAGIRTRYGLADAVVGNNYFFQTANAAAIIVDQEPGAVTSRLAVTANHSTADSTFAVILGTVDSSFSRNLVDSTAGTAIFVGGNNAGLAIKANKITNAGTRGIRFNTAFFGGAASTNVTVSRNTVDGSGIHGIVADSVAGETTLAASTIAQNVVSNSGRSGAGDGIRIEAPAGSGANGGNSIEANRVSGSFNHDCHDASVGSATGGTANTWSSNAAATQNVADLCFAGAANGVAD